ncbi:MAG: hypothetical protein COA88_02440 [Kordia sp.]|nr:MAG: hypothetical protein COA88_02440 [Kordia sp.]
METIFKNKAHTILLYYTSIDEVSDPKTLDVFLKKLPLELQLKNQRFKFLKDRQAHVLGRMLLHSGIKALKNIDCLNLVNYNEYGKPIISDLDIHFNISHSGEIVCCAFSIQSNIGVDVEQKKNIDYKDLLTSFNKEEQNIIVNSDDSFTNFYNYWVKREAIIKAGGKGFFSEYKDIKFFDNHVFLEGVKTYIEKIRIHHDYTGYLATDLPVDFMIVEYLNAEEIEKSFEK